MSDRKHWRVLVADDSPCIRRLVRAILEGRPEFEIVGEAADGNEAIDLTRTARPDLVILDIVMPDSDGIAALPLILAAAPAARVLVYSSLEDEATRERALAAGAAGYVEKGGPPDHLIRALQEIAAEA